MELTREADARLEEGDREGALEFIDQAIDQAIANGRDVAELHFNKAVVCLANSHGSTS